MAIFLFEQIEHKHEVIRLVVQLGKYDEVLYCNKSEAELCMPMQKTLFLDFSNVPLTVIIYKGSMAYYNFLSQILLYIPLRRIFMNYDIFKVWRNIIITYPSSKDKSKIFISFNFYPSRVLMKYPGNH